MIRRQLPAYSPVLPMKLAGAAWSALTSRATAREELRAYLADRYQAEAVVLTGSGTQALQLALEWSGSLGEAGAAPVALPGYSCFDVVTAAAGAGVGALFYDVDPESLAPETGSLRRALELGARRVVAASLYGFPLDWGRMRSLCEEFDALLIEDSAQGLGTRWEGREGGSFGDLTVLSFGRGKGWTGGGGGALLLRWSGPGLEERPERSLPLLSDASPAAGGAALVGCAVQWALGRPSLYRLPTSVPALGLGETRYKDPEPPISMSHVSSAIVRGHAEASARAVETRRRWAERWAALLRAEPVGASGIRPCRPSEAGEAAYLRFPVMVDEAERAERLAVDARAAGVTRGYPSALHELPQGRTLGRGGAELPGSIALARRLLTLPTHPRVSGRDLDLFRRILESAGP